MGALRASRYVAKGFEAERGRGTSLAMALESRGQLKVEKMSYPGSREDWRAQQGGALARVSGRGEGGGRAGGEILDSPGTHH